MNEIYRIAIDGPSGAGKSTIAKSVARALDIDYIDTGAMYRAIGYKMKKEGIDPEDLSAVQTMLDATRIDFRGGDIYLDEQVVNDLIRTPEMSMMASGVAAQDCVRAYLLDMQRQLARTHNVVMDGRDIGTVVLPHAQVKVYLTASAEVRADRRWKELTAKGEKVRYEDVYTDVVKRDEADMTRKIAPLKCADDAEVLDCSYLTIDQVVAEMKAIIRKKASV